jgi:Flp pilus assembly protein TadD
MGLASKLYFRADRLAMKRANFVFLFLLAAVFAVSQSAHAVQQRSPGVYAGIHGEVRYSRGGGTVENVLVQLDLRSGGLVAQVRTDRTGKFGFSGLAPAMYLVTASIEGFESARQEVDLTTSAAEFVILTLVPKKGQITPKSLPSEILPVSTPKQAIDEYDLGRSQLLNSSDPRKAIPHLEKAVSIYPDFLQAQLLLGTAYMDAHQVEKAESALKRVLAIEPKTPQALMALGELYRQKKNYPEAEKMIQGAVQLNNSSWQTHSALGRLYWEMGDIPRAGAEVGRALQINSGAAEAYLLAGNIFLKANRAQEALQMFNEYLRLEPAGPYAEATRKVVETLKTSGRSPK